jgi:hypothetical protein
MPDGGGEITYFTLKKAPHFCDIEANYPLIS